MLRMSTMLGLAAGGVAFVAACGSVPTRASADDARLMVVPAVYEVNETGAAGANVQLVRHHGYYHGGRGWGGGYRGYGYRYGGFYRPYSARPFYGVAPGYGYGYPGYGYGGYGGWRRW
jgi:hypothetical protein